MLVAIAGQSLGCKGFHALFAQLFILTRLADKHLDRSFIEGLGAVLAAGVPGGGSYAPAAQRALALEVLRTLPLSRFAEACKKDCSEELKALGIKGGVIPSPITPEFLQASATAEERNLAACLARLRALNGEAFCEGAVVDIDEGEAGSAEPPTSEASPRKENGGGGALGGKQPEATATPDSDTPKQQGGGFLNLLKNFFG